MADEEKKDKTEESAEKAEELVEEEKVEASTIAPKADVGVPAAPTKDDRSSDQSVREGIRKVKEEKDKPAEAKAEKSASAEATTNKPVPTGKFKEVIEKIENLSVLELAELVKELEERFGVSASAPMMAMPAVAGVAAAGAPLEEEKSSYDLVLASGGDKKIQVIKAVREIKPDLGLKEAKDLVDGAPKELVKGMKKEEAEEAKKKLETAGATVELK
jgi:large subunit ribosomal protein L7/L12